MKLKITILSAAVLFMLCSYNMNGQSGSENKEKVNIQNNGNWVSIFNGKNLDGWIPKVTGYKSGENPLNLFHVENGILEVDYSKFDKFNNRFGHLFYKEKLSSYILRVEYRFHGELLADAPRSEAFFCLKTILSRPELFLKTAI